jgi:hypothetical protein
MNFGSVGQGFKFVPDLSTADSFVYERSEDASDTLTYYSNDSAETFRALLNSKPHLATTGQRNSMIRPAEVPVSVPRRKAPDAPRSIPISLPEPRNEPRGSPDDPSRSMHSGDTYVGRRPSISGRPSHDPDAHYQSEVPRNRRLSGPVIPTGFGILPCEQVSPPSSKSSRSDRSSPPAIRTSPSGDGRRERYSSEREVSPTVENNPNRRISGISFPSMSPSSIQERDKPPTRRGSQSSGSSSSAGRHSPQEDKPWIAGLAPKIRSRILSRSRRVGGPKQIIVDGLETNNSQGPSRTVRFSEQLICPSPIPIEKRRRGFHNRRGLVIPSYSFSSFYFRGPFTYAVNFYLHSDQLWTNDGTLFHYHFLYVIYMYEKQVSTLSQRGVWSTHWTSPIIPKLARAGKMKKVFVSTCSIASFPKCLGDLR